MKHAARILIYGILSFVGLTCFSQDILFTITGKYENQKVSIDSIHFKNFSNGTILKFADLPGEEEYLINLTTGEILEPTGILINEKGGNFEILKSLPGELAIAWYDNGLTNAFIEIYNITGQLMHHSSLSHGEGKVQITLPSGKGNMYMVRIQSKQETKVFRAIGSPDQGNLNVYIVNKASERRSLLKKISFSSAPDFSVKLGDSLRIIAFKETLFSSPAFVKVGENNPIVISFMDNPPEDSTSVTDIDLNTYKIIRIGNRWWMAEDLRTTHYANGDEIPDGTGISDYRTETEPAYWFAYNDSLEYVPEYGRLYTWYAAADSRNICPEGWYVPGDAEWGTLASQLGGWELAGGKMKEAGTAHWQNPNEGATNESGFTALPSGSRQYSGGFGFLGTDGHWWSSTHANEERAWYRFASHFSPSLLRADPDKRYGVSVRCIKDDGVQGTIPSILTLDASEITESSAIINWKITSNGGSTIIETGIYIGTKPNPLLTGSKAPAGYGTGDISFMLRNLPHSTCYYYQSYAINSSGEAVGNEKNFLTTILAESDAMTDFDGNTYRTVKLWDQWWMAEDLKVTHFADGTPIPIVEDGNSWSNLAGPGYCWYNNDSAAHANTYGVLYNWYTVETGKLCPTGWHVPDNEEWTKLTDRLGGEDYSGGRLKEAGTMHWSEPNTGATDEAGFTALPGGIRKDFGTFEELSNRTSWWTATEHEYDPSIVRRRIINYNHTNIINRADNKKYGLSVRCLKDTVSTDEKSFLQINENEYELNNGAIIYDDSHYNISGIHSRAIYLLSPGHNINWETGDVTGSGTVVYFELYNKQPDIESGEYPFSTPELMETVLVLDTVICDSIDRNADGIINELDCTHSIIYTLPEGAKYLSSNGSAYSANTNLNDFEGLSFESGTAVITREGDLYTFEFDCVGENGDIIKGYYKGSLQYIDYSDNDNNVTFEYEEALNKGYTYLFKLVEHSWLIDGFFCGEYPAPSLSWGYIANRNINTTDTQVSQLWNNAYNLIFNANNIIDSITGTELTMEEKNRITAEARTMRAYGYFILTSKFGDVPIYPGITYSQIPRSTVGEVMNTIIADLTYAKSYLPYRNFGENDKNRFDRGSAIALMAKSYFFNQNWTEAYGKSLEIMNSGNYMVDGANKYASMSSPDNIQAYDSIQSFIFASTYDKGSVVSVSHYTEQLLIALECEVRMANLNLAGNLFMMLTGTENNAPTLENIYNLWMNLMNKEGITLSTIKRYGKVNEMLQIGDHQTILPIPQWLIDTNPFMTQNPGY